ncbi:MAG: tetratricopeptide repeat protein, partial [Planctomycetaceae bacterium]
MNVLESKISDRHRVLNPRAAAIVAVTVLAFLFGMRKLHDRQFSKTVDFLRQSACASLDAKDYRKAQMQLNQYLAFRSTDLDARKKLSSLLSTHIRTRPALEQAFHLNEELLRNDLPQEELRLEQARIAVQLGRFSDAAAHLRILQSLREESAEVWYLSGHCAKEVRRTEEAVRCYQRALACPNPPERAYEELAMLATANPHLMLDPETILDQMVVTCNSADAWRLRAMHLIETNEFSEALPHVWKGLAAAPDDVALNSILVHCLQSYDVVRKLHSRDHQGNSNFNNTDLPRAIRHLQGCVERNPQRTSFRVHLAALLWKDHQQAEAIGILETGIRHNSRAFPLHSALLEYLLTQEQTDKAERMLRSLPANALPKAERELLNGRVQLLRQEWKNADVAFQRAVAYADPGSALQKRAQLLLAVCRSNSGNAATAVDSFRTVVAGAPDSVAGRLGMALAWIKSGKNDMAIAEYRQLLDVPGVPAFLADLLIQRNLEQPAGLRNWTEVAELVREGNPFITDQTQRTLLRTDLLMASGRMTEAIASLESASTINPANPAFQRALARLNGEHSGELQSRLEQLAIDAPENNDVLAALMRLDLGANRAESALVILEDIATRQRNPNLSSAEALTLAIRTAERVIALEKRRGRTQYTELLQDATRRYAYQLTTINAAHEATLARILASQGRTSEALKRVRSIDSAKDPAIRSSALMAL